VGQFSADMELKLRLRPVSSVSTRHVTAAAATGCFKHNDVCLDVVGQ
jgi:hypothetical protein